MNIRVLSSYLFFNRKTSVSLKDLTLGCGVFLAFFCSLSLITSASANELHIEFGDSWVEEGYIFHVDIQLPPYNVYCTTTGKGYIGFNVYYEDTRSLEGEWTFGIAPWPEGLVSDSKVGSHMTAVAPQVYCSSFAPCTIQNVQIVKAWCPPLEGESFYAQ
jgi:hypothetical protein